MYGEMKMALKKLFKAFPTMGVRIELSLGCDPVNGISEEYTLWIAATKHYETFDSIEGLEKAVDHAINEYTREYREYLRSI
jgi:hypothetical protein